MKSSVQGPRTPGFPKTLPLLCPEQPGFPVAQLAARKWGQRLPHRQTPDSPGGLRSLRIGGKFCILQPGSHRVKEPG